MEDKIEEVRNNAQLKTYGGYFPVSHVEVVDEQQHIYKGKKVAIKGDDKVFERDYVFFSRNYQPDINDLDKIYPELSFSNELLGVSFILVPKEKLLFEYSPSSSIAIPSIDFSQKRLFQ